MTPAPKYMADINTRFARDAELRRHRRLVLDGCLGIAQAIRENQYTKALQLVGIVGASATELHASGIPDGQPIPGNEI